MRYTIAIHPSEYTDRDTPELCDASSPRWSTLLQAAGHEVRWVDVHRPDILEQLQGCDGFMWRWAHLGGMSRIARRLLPVIELQMGLAMYPDQNTCWHYDDKIAQAYLLKAKGIPVPETWIWFERDAAKAWATSASYPMVLKLATGCGSTNVRLVRDSSEARVWIDRLFDRRYVTLDEGQFRALPWNRCIRAAASALRHGGPQAPWDDGYELQSGYVLFQEFLPGNGFDTRVTVIGNRAFADRRQNRPGDFRASGSGTTDFNPELIDERFVRLAFLTARSLACQSCAIDGLYKGTTPVVGEISYTYPSWVVHSCPGHWRLDGSPDTGDLVWVPGRMWPEDAQVEDFLRRLDARAVSRSDGETDSGPQGGDNLRV
jgi:hypothetical protein